VKINVLLSVKFFKTESGSEPVRDWLLEDLTIEERKVVGRDIIQKGVNYETQKYRKQF
jgi:hypothetical protein